MDQLTYAITEAGGVTALASALGVKQPRVSNWISRGSVPDGWLEVLRSKFPIESKPNTPQTPAPQAQAATKTVAQGVGHA